MEEKSYLWSGQTGKARVDTLRVINLPNTIKGISTKAYSLSPYIKPIFKPYKALLIPLPYKLLANINKALY